MDVKFDKGEELLLFLKNVDVKRGAYDLFSTDDTPAQKYPISLRDAVVSTIPKNTGNVNNQDYSNDGNCHEKFFGNDSYWYCTTKEQSHVPVETLMDKVRGKLVEHISEEYLEKHFDLVVVYDQPEPVYEPVPNGSPRIIPERADRQNIEFVFTVDGTDFIYSMRTNYDKESNQIHLKYIPPKEIQSIVNSDAGINEMIYSCLDTGTYKFLYDQPVIRYHIDDGFSPVIQGHGPPTVYDRWSDDAVQDREKVFQLWLATGKVDCAKVHHDFEPDSEKRPETTLLIDAVQAIQETSASVSESEFSKLNAIKSNLFAPDEHELGDDHQHASILVKIFGDKFDFSHPDYQIKASWIHFEAQDGNTIHHHSKGIALGYLFDTLNLGLSSDCFVFQEKREFCTNEGYSLKFYVNGDRVTDIRDYVVMDDDRVLVSYGPENTDGIENQLAELESQELVY